jgi:hypothetical protein
MHAKAIKKHWQPKKAEPVPVIAVAAEELINEDDEQLIGEVVDKKSNMAHNARIRRDQWAQ